MEIPLYQVDAFASNIFEGNPAAVCPLDHWLDDQTLQKIAMENNLSETAFYVSNQNGFHIRWFTPYAEIDLCGHATLATAFVLYECFQYPNDEIIFSSKSGELKVQRKEKQYQLDFPRIELELCRFVPTALLEAFDKTPLGVFKGTNYVAIFHDEEDVLSLKPDFSRLKDLDLQGVSVTAPSKKFDFINRYFVPKLGVDEDPVTGSAFCELAPYWAGKLHKDILTAKQVSKRGGLVDCKVMDNRVLISGEARLYMQARLLI
jgi:PhzF family phenazine biosynthesis protein